MRRHSGALVLCALFAVGCPSDPEQPCGPHVPLTSDDVYGATWDCRHEGVFTIACERADGGLSCSCTSQRAGVTNERIVEAAVCPSVDAPGDAGAQICANPVILEPWADAVCGWRLAESRRP